FRFTRRRGPCRLPASALRIADRLEDVDRGSRAGLNYGGHKQERREYHQDHDKLGHWKLLPPVGLSTGRWNPPTRDLRGTESKSWASAGGARASAARTIDFSERWPLAPVGSPIAPARGAPWTCACASRTRRGRAGKKLDIPIGWMAVHSELCTVHRKRGALPLATAIGGSGRPFRMEPVINTQCDVAPSTMIRRVVKGRPAAGPRATHDLVRYCGYATSGS